jgi:hypothetical protein
VSNSREARFYPLAENVFEVNINKKRRFFMKKVLVVFACILFSFVGWAAEDNQGTYAIPAISSTESQPTFKILEDLSAYEKSNSIINIESKEESDAQADIIEETWNSGNYEEAIELLKNSTELENAALGIQWKNPVKTRSMRWAGDVRVDTVDMVMDIAFDVDNSNGNLIAALLYRSDLSEYTFTINMSADTGKNWTQTYLWTTTVDHEIVIDGAVYDGYFYLAYPYVNDSEGRIRRFSTNDGSADLTYGYVTVIDEGDALREISLTSDADDVSPNYLFYFSIMDNDSLRFYFNSNPGDSTWSRAASLNNVVGNADRGLDACWTAPNTLWASFIGTDDELYFMGGWSYWTVWPSHLNVGSSPEYVTSVSAYGDSVMIVFPYEDTPNYDVRYYITLNGGSSWGVGTLLNDLDIPSRVNDVTARGGDGFAAVYHTTGVNAEGFYRHRSYSSALWTPPVAFADSVPRSIIKPCIERVADGIYGILYVNYPEQFAWFDRSDWLTPDGLSLSPDGETIELGETLELTAYLEKDASGVEGEELNFAVITGDGSLDPTSGVTDGSGEVHTEFTAGSTAEVVTVEVTWVSYNLFDTLSATVDIEVVAGGVAEGPDVSGISAAFGSGEILCAVAEAGEVKVTVYDKLGRETGILLNRDVERGIYPLSLKNLNLTSDIYFVEMRGPGIDTKIKVTLIN